MKIITILGTRPEIIKLSPLLPLLDNEFDHKIIHTGQHYSYNMDRLFFEDLNLRACDYTLNVGSGSHAQQTGKMMVGIEKILIDEKPELVIVQGDTNSTLSGALTAAKLNIKVVHVEAGCRSFDKQMPEEVNRVITDHCSDLLFAPDEIAYENLKNEGISQESIYLVGNTSTDACLRATKIYNLDGQEEYEKQNYALVTIHRQENTNLKKLENLLNSLKKISNRIKIIFPVHLRTRKIIEENKLKTNKNIILADPLGYKEFIGLLANSKFVMTDSGGIQEEAGILNVPCLILRKNTEWMYLVDIGKNVLLGTDENEIISFVNRILDNEEILENMRGIEIPIVFGSAQKIVSIIKKKYF